MPLPAVRHASEAEAAPLPKDPVTRPAIQIAEDASDAAPSPARALQARLQHDLLGEARERPADGRWPLYIALPFWGGASALLWAAIIGCGWLLLRHL